MNSDSRISYKNLHELDSSVKTIGTLGNKFHNLSLAVSMHSAATVEERTKLSDNLFVTTTGEGAARVELSQLPQFFKAVEVCLLALLAVGSVPTPSEGFGSQGDEGNMFSSDGEIQHWHFTPDARDNTRSWVQDVACGTSFSGVLPCWKAMTQRASDLMLREKNAATALTQACREMSPFSRLPVPATIAAGKADRAADENSKELARLKSDLKGARHELDQARSQKRSRDPPLRPTPYRGSGSQTDRAGGSHFDKNITSPTGSRVCGDFQRGACTRSACVFAHECRRCGSAAHGADTCPKRQGGGVGSKAARARIFDLRSARYTRARSSNSLLRTRRKQRKAQKIF